MATERPATEPMNPGTNPTLEPQPKHVLRSKTFWIQLLAVAGALFPAVREWIAGNPVEAVAVLAAVNVVVRFVTRDAVSIFPEGGSSGPGVGMPLIMAACAAVAVGTLLPSCGQYPIAVALQGPRGSVAYSAKGGLVVTVNAEK